MAKQACPECNFDNPERVTKCQQCGSRLDATILKFDLKQMFTDDMTLFPMISPPEELTKEHQQSDDMDGTIVDTQDLGGLADELTDTSQMGMALMQGGLILREIKSNTKFHIKVDELSEIVIGRANRKTDYVPTVDLSVVDGHKYGVSRRHATLRRNGGLLLLYDHHSVNGTFLNGQKLVPEQSRIVRDKDVIRISGVSLQVVYVNQIL